MDVKSFGEGELSSTMNDSLAIQDGALSESDGHSVPSISLAGKRENLRWLPPVVRRPLQVVISQDYIGVLFAIIVMVTVISVVHPNFLQFGQITDILAQATYVVLLASGMAFLLAMGELDLSVRQVSVDTRGTFFQSTISAEFADPAKYMQPLSAVH